MALNPSTYSATGITFAKANANNIAIAKSPKGTGTLTEVITPVTLEVGKITSDDTNNGIIGTGTLFQTLEVGQYLFYYDETGTPALLGQIASIDSNSNTSLTLTANATSTQTDVYFGVSNNIVSGSENLIMQIPVFTQSAGIIIMPNWNAYRVPTPPQNESSLNSSAVTNLRRITKVKDPGTIISPAVNIAFTIKPLWGYTVFENPTNKALSVFASTNDFPVYCYAEINPYGNTGQNLPPYALFQLFAEQRFSNNGIQVTTNYLFDDLKLAGY